MAWLYIMAIQQEIGTLGEDIAVKYLKNKGYSVIERNYWKKWGEIDVIAENNGILHFVEVKSVSRPSLVGQAYATNPDSVSRERLAFDPQDHMNAEKMHRLRKVIESYISAKNLQSDWQVDLLLAYLDKTTKTAKVDFIQNITL